MAVHFDYLFAAKIPQSPPPYVGTHLYTVWNVPEPDRVAVIWVMKRFVDREAVFHFIEPFDKVNVGKPFDMPEAGVRRSGTQSATRVLIADKGLKIAALDELARTTDLIEITPWAVNSDPKGLQLVDRLKTIATNTCGRNLSNSCLPCLMTELDRWFASNEK